MKPEEFLIPSPADLENESIILCGMLRDNVTLAAMLDVLTPADLSAQGADVFRAIVAVWENASEGRIDPELVLRELIRQTKIPETQWRDALMNILESDPSGVAAYTRCELVKDRSIRKQLVYAAQDCLRECLSPAMPAEDIVGRAQNEFLKIGSDGKKSNTYSFRQIIKDVYHRIDSGTQDRGLESGFIDFDRKTGGFHNGELIILAARPGVGKSAFALAVAINVAKLQIPGLIISLEMSREELVMRHLCGASGIKSQFIRGNRMSAEQTAKFMDAGHNASNLPIWVNDCGTLKTRHIRAIARRLKATANIRYVVIDYLQLIDADDRRQGRVEQVGEMSRSLKMLARDLEVPVICLAQLNRDVEKRNDNKPRLSDLRESGSIEQDADTVIFLSRVGDESKPIDTLSIQIAKQRNGPVGELCLAFRKDTMTFENMIPGMQL